MHQKRSSDVDSIRQRNQWSLLGIDLEDFDLPACDTVPVSISLLFDQELVLEYPVSLILCILELPALANNMLDSQPSLYPYFRSIEKLSNEFHSHILSHNSQSKCQRVVDYWNYRSPDLFISKQTLLECGKSESVVVKQEQGAWPATTARLRKGSFKRGAKTKAKTPSNAASPPSGNNTGSRYLCGASLP